MRGQFRVFLLVFLALSGSAAFAQISNCQDLKGISPQWLALAAGVEYSQIAVEPGNTSAILHVVKINPIKAEIRMELSSELGVPPMTAREWAKKRKLLVAINAGMFHTDHLTHVGYLKKGSHTNSSDWHDKYHSFLMFDPLVSGLSMLEIRDRDALLGSEPNSYGSFVQNLRLIKENGVNAWPQNSKKWSEAAIGIDGHGQLLFLFSRHPYTMFDFNTILLCLPLDVQRAMHAEGGPEASLSIHSPALKVNLMGSYETGFNENDLNNKQWPLPFVLGVSQ